MAAVIAPEVGSQQGPSRPSKSSEVPLLPTHLVVLINGILSSAQDWKYAKEELSKRLGKNVYVYASMSNSWFNTLHGIDVAGRRLAEEIRGVVRSHPSLVRISFVAHSLGGLIARYAVSVLYTSLPPHHPVLIASKAAQSNGSPPKTAQTNGSSREIAQTNGSQPEVQFSSGSPPEIAESNGSLPNREKLSRPVELPTIAGLEPVAFVTLASPHLGVRGNKQLPFLLGLKPLETLAAPIAPLVVGRTGRQLFLTDGNSRRPPLLLKMSRDCREGPFVSSLRCFQLRVLYANAGYDHMVGWRTSCIRRERELPKLPSRPVDKRYRHVVSIENCPEVPLASASVLDAPSSAGPMGAGEINFRQWRGIGDTHDLLEEEMVAGLQQVAWRRVDVSFTGALFPFMAHHSIQVKHKVLHWEGAGVIAHLADTLRSLEEGHAAVFLEAKL
ncbi:hypothetical protein KFL_002750100 [Klebsormidium nitens]|uniref:DUF676 domain-containing protein n=1 Tax=Klebsormidium nitens TaxID=105231 RepID=A0A1Y1I6P8_KLENI|nr:hypothetical protein KFL_002750100 [Klebsormidium nitens]|eukprot:GAQ86193.1 hypothetical protein KFL_002750100 [Klebsormidium nitens]